MIELRADLNPVDCAVAVKVVIMDEVIRVDRIMKLAESMPLKPTTVV